MIQISLKYFPMNSLCLVLFKANFSQQPVFVELEDLFTSFVSMVAEHASVTKFSEFTFSVAKQLSKLLSAILSMGAFAVDCKGCKLHKCRFVQHLYRFAAKIDECILRIRYGANVKSSVRTFMWRSHMFVDTVKMVLCLSWLKFSTFKHHQKLFHLAMKCSDILPRVKFIDKTETAGTIYCFMNPDSKGVYIGQTMASIEKRASQHWSSVFRHVKNSASLPGHRAVRSQGAHRYVFIPLLFINETVIAQHRMLFLEKCVINFAKPSLNMPWIKNAVGAKALETGAGQAVLPKRCRARTPFWHSSRQCSGVGCKPTFSTGTSFVLSEFYRFAGLRGGLLDTFSNSSLSAILLRLSDPKRRGASATTSLTRVGEINLTLTRGW